MSNATDVQGLTAAELEAKQPGDLVMQVGWREMYNNTHHGTAWMRREDGRWQWDDPEDARPFSGLDVSSEFLASHYIVVDACPPVTEAEAWEIVAQLIENGGTHGVHGRSGICHIVQRLYGWEVVGLRLACSMERSAMSATKEQHDWLGVYRWPLTDAGDRARVRWCRKQRDRALREGR